MAVTYKVLGQVAPNANTVSNVYTVPAATQAVISTIIVVNRKNNAKGSLMNRFTGFFKKNTRSKNLRNQNNEKTPLINQNNIPPQEKQGVFSKCSIL